ETQAGRALPWDNLKPGSYRVQARKPGYEPWEQEVTVVANKSTLVVIDIKPRPLPPSVRVPGLSETPRGESAPPTVIDEILKPKNGEEVSGSINLQATISRHGIIRVRICSANGGCQILPDQLTLSPAGVVEGQLPPQTRGEHQISVGVAAD